MRLSELFSRTVVESAQPNQIEIRLDDVTVPGEVHDLDHARNRASKLISYGKGKVAEVYVNGKLKMRMKLNTPREYFDEQGMAEGVGNLAQALDKMSGGYWGWYQDEEESRPDLDVYHFDDGEGGFYATGIIKHNLRTDKVYVKFDDRADYYGENVDQIFPNIGAALKSLSFMRPDQDTRGRSYDVLATREPLTPDDLYKSDRVGRKGALSGGAANRLKDKIRSAQGRLGPKGELPRPRPRLVYSKQDMAEGFPQPGESSGKAKQFNPNAKVQTKAMTLDQILATVKGIPYVNNVVDDWDAKDYSWNVTKKVIEYAQYLKKNPQSVANLPPLVVIDGRLDDGAHRLSAINLLQKRMDPKNPLWKQAKLKVNFATSADVAPGQVVAEGSVQDQLHRRHQELRNKSGLPDPDYYQELKASYDIEDDNKRLAQQAEIKKKYRVLEATGDKQFDAMMKKVAKTPTQAQRNAERIRQKREREEETRKHFANGGGFGPSPADKLSVRKGMAEAQRTQCPECGGPAYSNQMLAEKQDACYHKVKSRYKVWPSAYASGALVRCRKVGAKNWGNKSKK